MDGAQRRQRPASALGVSRGGINKEGLEYLQRVEGPKQVNIAFQPREEHPDLSVHTGLNPGQEDQDVARRQRPLSASPALGAAENRFSDFHPQRREALVNRLMRQSRRPVSATFSRDTVSDLPPKPRPASALGMHRESSQKRLQQTQASRDASHTDQKEAAHRHAAADLPVGLPAGAGSRPSTPGEGGGGNVGRQRPASATPWALDATRDLARKLNRIEEGNNLSPNRPPPASFFIGRYNNDIFSAPSPSAIECNAKLAMLFKETPHSTGPAEATAAAENSLMAEYRRKYASEQFDKEYNGVMDTIDRLYAKKQENQYRAATMSLSRKKPVAVMASTKGRGGGGGVLGSLVGNRKDNEPPPTVEVIKTDLQRRVDEKLERYRSDPMARKILKQRVKSHWEARRDAHATPFMEINKQAVALTHDPDMAAIEREMKFAERKRRELVVLQRKQSIEERKQKEWKKRAAEMREKEKLHLERMKEQRQRSPSPDASPKRQRRPQSAMRRPLSALSDRPPKAKRRPQSAMAK